tara:strand:+ start:404 stop:607 length:204 start_codon:yes stop_codon:yes gene_type:complete
MTAFALIVVGGLFFNENAEFFAQANKNFDAGMIWHKITCRAPDPNELSIPLKNEDTGKEYVCFKMKK